jgi:ferredoxin
MQFIIAESECMSSGECVLAAPDVFELGDDGVAVVLPGAPAVDADRAAKLVRNCPGAAVRLASAE